ncbi:SocA family protein [Rhizobium leguminosarum]|uniref:type VI toxin-antitoxin system SocA family antitoxin n=1 Tax=Rhizobium leguminosarum TaxID=384 RepID=UPI001C96D184|nr:Panacea domain-containing protein [Rhizobium leguminosarum]MBY5592054.1 SocA family protein [Rhizobium leguminosarum]
MSGGYDPRAVANLMLDEADRLGIQLTNLSLQKLLYFAHGIYLMQTKTPLVSGYFEAWQYGPVHPSAYRAFKDAGSSAITFRATGQDILTGQPRAITTPSDVRLIGLLQQVLNSYGRMPTGRLVDLSHAKDSPWWYVVEKAKAEVAIGLRITDNLILERFRHHKMSVGAEPLSGDPNDDTPFA